MMGKPVPAVCPFFACSLLFFSVEEKLEQRTSAMPWIGIYEYARKIGLDRCRIG
jgi:hypothetical protein